MSVHDPTPGDLGRVALNDDAAATAIRVARWAADAAELERVARWYGEFAYALDALILDKADGQVAQ